MRYLGLLIMLVFISQGCEKDFLVKNPYNVVSEGTFWKTQDDALMALAGIYHVTAHNQEQDFLGYTYIIFNEQKSDNAYELPGKDRENIVNGNMGSTNTLVELTWKTCYTRIGRCNYFLGNIEKVEMDEALRTEMKAEARFLRAVFYFFMSQYWGSVPLVTEILTVDEANSVTVDSKETVVDFVLTELTEAAGDLPVTRPASEKGRATRGAALAFKGRLLMAEEQWSEAVTTYKSIMDLGVYSIDPRYREIFLEEGEDSPEHIFSTQYIPEIGGNYSSQTHYRLSPYVIGGSSQVNPLNSLVESYECIDGLTIDESPLYDPVNPWESGGERYRDPRLYMTVLLPNHSMIKGNLYVTHPDSASSPDRLPEKSTTGYGWLKYIDENYGGDYSSYGGDMPMIRYAEVLLSYLESKLEAGDPISQALLDETINQVRGREAVDMPPVTEKDPSALRTILRRERRVELALEGIRYWDLLRWGIAHTQLNGPLYGSMVCTDPGNCAYNVDEGGHYLVGTRAFRQNIDYQWPIPQSELDINPNLDQNPDYQ